MSPNMRRRPGAQPEASSNRTMSVTTTLLDDVKTTFADALDADPWWFDIAERALAICAESGSEFTAQALRDLGVPEPEHPNRWGALFKVASQKGIIVPVRFSVSTRRARHGGVLRIWRGAGAMGGPR